MRDWNRGFVRLAMVLGAPIVPVAVFGGEECFPVAWTVKVLEPLIGSIVGLPLAALPLPARWKIVFHQPAYATAPGNPVRRDPQYCNAIAQRLQGVVQETLDREASRRPLARLSTFVATVSNRLRARTLSDGVQRDPPLASEGPGPAEMANRRPGTRLRAPGVKGGRAIHGPSLPPRRSASRRRRTRYRDFERGRQQAGSGRRQRTGAAEAWGLTWRGSSYHRNPAAELVSSSAMTCAPSSKMTKTISSESSTTMTVARDP